MVIVEILEKKGSLTDVELLEALKSIYKDLSINELNKTLMRMEITGLISVSSLTKGRRLVQLTKK
jgi:transcription initiation factor IIE alpha subunit